MDFIFEFLIDLLIEGGIEISSNRKISKLIRYPIGIIIILFFLIVILGIFALGISYFKENVLVSLLFIIISIMMLILSIKKFKYIYIKKEELK